MCVFLTLRLNKAQIKKQYDTRDLDDLLFSPTYVMSAFSFNPWPVITSQDTRSITMLNWGLVPHWIKDEQAALKIRSSTVNARIETVKEKPSFRASVKSRRCLVLADGFFEFREVNKKKYPYFIQLKEGKPFTIAGIYDNWTNRVTGSITSSFSILTTDANPLMEKIHNRKKRMPVILPGGLENSWVANELEPEALKQPYPESEMEAWTISRLLTSRQSNPNVPEVIDPFVYPELQMLDSFQL